MPPESRAYVLRCIGGIACAVFLTILVWAQTLFLNKFVVQQDIFLHMRWAIQFQAALDEGILIPRWAFASHGGLGDPTFLYYQPLFYYLTSFLKFLGFSQTKAFVVSVMVPSALAGAVVFCQMVRTYSPLRASLGMAMVVTSPVLFFLSTQYGAFPWVLSTPFCILFALESTNDRPDPIRLAMWISLVCLSHLLSGLIILMCVGGARLLFRPPNRRTLSDHFQWAYGVVLGLAVAAYFVYPAMTLQGLVNPSAWTSDPTFDWHPSFAFSTFTFLRYGARWFLIQWPFAIFGLMMSVLALVIVKKNAALHHPHPRKMLAARVALVALVGLALSSELAYPLFAFISPLQKLQWPYRFVVISSVLASVAFSTVATFSPLWNIRRNWLQYGCVCVIGLQLAFALFLQWSLFAVGKPLPTTEQVMKGEFGQPEYLVAQRGPDWARYNQEGSFAGECTRLALECETTVRESHASSVQITSPREATVRLPIFAFPGWRLSVDGLQQPLIADPGTGLISVAIAPGKHEVRTTWAGTAHERTGRLISLVALAWLITCGLHRLLYSRRRASASYARSVSNNAQSN